jgi:hypothetical protein
VLTEGESCESCAQDCVVRSCTDSGTDATFGITLVVPGGSTATSVTFLVGYKGNVVSIPDSGIVTSVQQRILMRQSGASYVGNDLDFATRVVMTRNAGVAVDRAAFNLMFDACQGATASPSDLGCNVEGCSGEFGLIDGCRCTVSVP